MINISLVIQLNYFALAVESMNDLFIIAEITMLTDFLKIGCLFNSMYAVISVYILLIYFKRMKLFYSLAVILNTSFLLNAVLKSFFKVPLMPHLGEGYAFPSGHAQLGMVLWGWICLHGLIKKTTVSVILVISGLSMFALNYHAPIEILAGYFIGILLIWLFNQYPLFNYPEWLLVFNSCLMIIIFKRYFHIYLMIDYIICTLFLGYSLLQPKK